jgi:hypothetical protein
LIFSANGHVAAASRLDQNANDIDDPSAIRTGRPFSST